MLVYWLWADLTGIRARRPSYHLDFGRPGTRTTLRAVALLELKNDVDSARIEGCNSSLRRTPGTGSSTSHYAVGSERQRTHQPWPLPTPIQLPTVHPRTLYVASLNPLRLSCIASDNIFRGRPSCCANSPLPAGFLLALIPGSSKCRPSSYPISLCALHAAILGGSRYFHRVGLGESNVLSCRQSQLLSPISNALSSHLNRLLLWRSWIQGSSLHAATSRFECLRHLVFLSCQPRRVSWVGRHHFSMVL